MNKVKSRNPFPASKCSETVILFCVLTITLELETIIDHYAKQDAAFLKGTAIGDLGLHVACEDSHYTLICAIYAAGQGLSEVSRFPTQDVVVISFDTEHHGSASVWTEIGVSILLSVRDCQR